jgi:hypothetical protein
LQEKSIGTPNLSGDYFARSLSFCATGRIDWALGPWGHGQSKHLATLYLEDISDFIVECVDDNFGFSRYAERLGRSANSFDNCEALTRTNSIDEVLLSILKNE